MKKQVGGGEGSSFCHQREREWQTEIEYKCQQLSNKLRGVVLCDTKDRRQVKYFEKLLLVLETNITDHKIWNWVEQTLILISCKSKLTSL